MLCRHAAQAAGIQSRGASRTRPQRVGHLSEQLRRRVAREQRPLQRHLREDAPQRPQVGRCTAPSPRRCLRECRGVEMRTASSHGPAQDNDCVGSERRTTLRIARRLVRVLCPIIRIITLCVHTAS